MTHARLLAAVAALALPLAAGCGGAVPAPSKVPSAMSVEAPGTVEGASVAVDQAERTIDDLLAERGRSHQVFAEAPGPPPPPPPAVVAPPPPPSPAPSSAPGAMKLDADEAPRQPVDPCSTACSALASMERATTHLCDLAGGDDARCSRARARVENASARVHAACPACRGS